MARRLINITILFIFVFLSSASAQINEKNLMKTINYLASKELRGRLPGDIGYAKATKFIVNNLELNKIKPLFKSYFQNFKVEYNAVLGPEHFAVIKNGKKAYFKLGPDYVYRAFTGAGKMTAPVVFCGYGLSQPELGYDDYAGIDVKGKIVMAFKYNPKWNLNNKAFTNGNPREKAIVAFKHGAIGILFVSQPNDADPQKPIGSTIHGEGEQMTNFPEIHVGLNVADFIFDGSGYTLKQLQTKIDDEKRPSSVPMTTKADLEVHTKYVKEQTVSNIVAVIRGIDPLLKDEYVIIGAHLDHVGSQADKVYFPGANDNGSGSAALLQIARECVRNNIKPKRTIVFAFFACEEQGLYGSGFLAKNLPFPKEKVKAMINMDCIGFGDSLQVGGGNSFPELWNIAKEMDSKNDKLLVSSTGNGGGADAEAFFQIGIPTLYFVTTNSYKHLHLPTDKPETLNQPLFAAAARLAYNTLIELSNR